jgi:hypothetical protein
MISKDVAQSVHIAYEEISKGEKLLAEIDELRQLATRNHSENKPFQLSVPCGEITGQNFTLDPSLTIAIIKGHIALRKAELLELNEQVKREVLS